MTWNYELEKEILKIVEDNPGVLMGAVQIALEKKGYPLGETHDAIRSLDGQEKIYMSIGAHLYIPESNE